MAASSVRAQARASERGDGHAAADTVLALPAGFGPEGIALGPGDASLWVGSMRTGRLVRYDIAEGGGAPGVLATARLGTGWSALGLARGDGARLWVVACALPEAEGFDAAMAGRCALVELDARDGRERRRIAAPGVAAWNDVTAHPDGRVLVSDGRSGAIWEWRPGDGALRPLVAPGTLRSAQGMALAADGRSLVVADYALGLARVTLATGAVRLLPRAPDVDAASLRGLDGLVRLPEASADGDAAAERFAAVQNGRAPGRVVLLTVRGDSVVRAQPLLADHPALDEPTLLAYRPADRAAAARGGELLLVAGSLWPYLERDGSLRGTPRPTAILRIRLP